MTKRDVLRQHKPPRRLQQCRREVWWHSRVSRRISYHAVSGNAKVSGKRS